MHTLSSHPSKLREIRVSDGVNTGQPILDNRWALDVVAHLGVQFVVDDNVDSSTTSVITAASHVAKVGDLIVFSSGTEAGKWFTIAATTANTLTVNSDFSVAPVNGDGFSVYRHRPLVLDSNGALILGVAAPAITNEFIVAVATTNTAVLGADNQRKGGWVRNIDATIDIYVSMSSTAATNKPTKLRPNEYLYLSGYHHIHRGAIAAIHADSGTKNLEVVTW